MGSTHGRATVVVTALLAALGLAAANVFVLVRVISAPAAAGVPLVQAVADAYAARPDVFLYLTLSPIVAGALLALVAGLAGGGSATPAKTEEPQPPAASPHASALRLLALLQQEGRLIDFLEEDIDAYDDAQVGAAVRAIHSGCRKALRERLRIERIRPEQDGATVRVEPGFDAAEVRLTGNVHGKPPFEGTLQHGGWRAAEVRLPDPMTGADATVLAAAEVEIG
jgi:hypothetical protein